MRSRSVGVCSIKPFGRLNAVRVKRPSCRMHRRRRRRRRRSDRVGRRQWRRPSIGRVPQSPAHSPSRSPPDQIRWPSPPRSRSPCCCCACVGRPRPTNWPSARNRSSARAIAGRRRTTGKSCTPSIARARGWTRRRAWTCSWTYPTRPRWVGTVFCEKKKQIAIYRSCDGRGSIAWLWGGWSVSFRVHDYFFKILVCTWLFSRSGANIHGQLVAATAVQHIRRQQHYGEIAVPGHVQQRHTRDQGQELSPRFGRRTVDTQQQPDRIERHWIPSSQVCMPVCVCFWSLSSTRRRRML